MDKLEIYNQFRTVPEEALRPFTKGAFSGNDINNMWRIKCLTELFGPVGIGWIPKILKLWTVTVPKTEETIAYAHISFQYKYNDKWSEPIEATGGNTMEQYYKDKKYWKANDEAYKGAVSDALGVICKFLGIGADTYFANDKSKYTEEEEPKVTKGKETKHSTPYTEALKMSFKVKDKTYILGELTEDNLRVLIERENMPEEIKEAARIILKHNEDKGGQ